MPKTRRLLLSLPLALLLLTGCETMTPNDFKDRTPKLDLFEYFQGQTQAWGLFEDRFGKVRRQFQVDIQGTVADGTLTLGEGFRYDDGELARRVWTIRRDGPDGYVGQAADVIGEARGRAAGNALNWAYTMDLPMGGSTWRGHDQPGQDQQVGVRDWAGHLVLREGGGWRGGGEVVPSLGGGPVWAGECQGQVGRLSWRTAGVTVRQRLRVAPATVAAGSKAKAPLAG